MFLVIEPAVVSSRCPLLPAEAVADFSPQLCMRIPSGSAWIAQELDLSAYTDDAGSVTEGALQRALVACVDTGDRQHDEMDWPDPRVQYDSWLNRRLAIALRGWGDIVDKRGLDPASLGTLRQLEELAEWVCLILHSRSRELARHGNWCPALDEAGASVIKKKGSLAWRRRWRTAIQDVAVRHRNLTTMSPWDVFPRGKSADLRNRDLLPLLRYADSLSFQRDVSISHWNVNDFKGFYDRVAAIMRCNGGADLIAKQV
jgi:hypothetical protein